MSLSGLCRVTEHLFVSSGRAAGDRAQRNRCQITCVISVTETPAGGPPEEEEEEREERLHIPLPDSPLSALSEHFDPVSDKIQQVAERGGRTLLHCRAGVSRSAALCLAYLMKHRSLSLLEAHAWLKSCRPIVRPNAGFWRQLVRYEMELRGCNSVRMVASSVGEIPDLYEAELRDLVPL